MGVPDGVPVQRDAIVLDSQVDRNHQAHAGDGLGADAAPQPDPESPRYTRAVLTDAGWNLVVAAAPGHVTAVRRYVIDGLTDEQVAALREVARHVTEQVDEAAAEESRRP
ncbi:hypothetical protein GCM10011608_47740 [Micromonospora sonchi]|uniref:MarR family transcriptional regulator n=1 Tax=Micromonospora sonchi TaxID=1763543 RepID=A0A917U6E2_9ACTN|nr:hypothetical protein [Micromonospora sonchi]GGM57275.1 hypothetical protein GCM10011608_47740 [Micromonospora sonchi]